MTESDNERKSAREATLQTHTRSSLHLINAQLSPALIMADLFGTTATGSIMAGRRKAEFADISYTKPSTNTTFTQE